jgi:hypothetical protein
MLARRKVFLGMFFAMLVLPYSLWLASSVDKPLWADESITVALVQSATIKHMFSAVLLGLDATPPLYTGYGWFMLQYVGPGVSPELLLRVTNAGLIGATLWILYLLIRRYFDQTTALTTIGAFILLELSQLQFLTLEIRTYAALVFFTALAIYAALRAIDRPSWMSLICTMLAFCLLVSSHVFGVVYVVSIVSCMIIVAAVGGDLRLVLNSCLTGLPAVVMFFLWIPVLNYQAQLSSWILRPGFRVLLESTYPPVNKLRLPLLLIAALIMLWRYDQIPKYTMMLIQGLRLRSPTHAFIVALPVTFGTNTLAVWLFSRIVFPVFVPRYFFPNILLHTIWLTILVDCALSQFTPAKTKYGLALASAVLAGLSIKFWQLNSEVRIPCFDPSQGTYIEDPFRDHGLIVALWSHTWLSRLNRPGETIVYPNDEGPRMKNGILYPPYVYDYRLVSRFAKWLGVNAVMTTSQLLDTKPDFMVLDDGEGPWLKYIQLRHKLKLIPLAEMKGSCTLWRVETLE